MEKDSTAQIVLYLLNCAVNGRVPEKLPEEIDYNELLKWSRFHSVTAMVSMALDAGGYLSETYMSQALIKEWAGARIGAMRKNLMFDAERAQILKHLEEEKIWYMPLKGSILKELYPDVGMRQMADNDILFDKVCRSELRDYMESRGYEVESYEKSNHDIYMKAPFYNFEFHVDLFGEETYPDLAAYYKDTKGRLQKDEGNQYGYHFSDEDFYIYMMAHAFKHYRTSGTGIRLLSDVYVYVRKKGDTMDWDYIRKELKKMEFDELDETVRGIAMKIFDPSIELSEIMPDEEAKQEVLSYLFGSGTYGTISNRVKKDLASLQKSEEQITLWTKVKFCLHRLFPGMDHMRKNEPLIYKHKWLLPFFWIYRLFRGIFKNGKRILAEFRAIKKAK